MPPLILSTIGRRATRDQGIVFKRELTEADLPLLTNPPPVGRPLPELTKIRSAHHGLARLLAKGVAQTEISEITGYTPSRISVLKADPAFQELISYYESNTSEVFVDAGLRLQAIGLLAAEEIQARLEEDASKVPMGMLKDLVDSTIGPKAKAPGAAAPQASGPPISLNISFHSSQQGKVIEGTPLHEK